MAQLEAVPAQELCRHDTCVGMGRALCRHAPVPARLGAVPARSAVPARPAERASTGPPSHSHPLRHSGRGSPPSNSQPHDYSMEKYTHLLLTHNPCQEPELWPVDRHSASSALLCRLRASNRVARGRIFLPVVSSRRCCRRGHAQHLCPWPKPPQWAPAEAGEAPS
eukprot:scaffold3978_cov112-Isochrysis_galbana.AAC.1